MKAQVLNRKIHYWLAIIIALPVLIMIGSGLLLQLKKDFAWIQPPEQRAAGRVPQVTFDQILAVCRSVPQAGVQEWSDVHRLDVRPDRGMLKVTTKTSWELQIDTTTGAVLQVAYRRSDLIESIHDGSWFSDAVKYAVFLPAGVSLLVLWITGMYLFAPHLARARRRK